MKEEREFVAKRVHRGSRGRGSKESSRERLRVAVQSNYNTDVLHSVRSPLKIVLKVSLWNQWVGLSFFSIQITGFVREDNQGRRNGTRTFDKTHKRRDNVMETHKM